MASKKHKAKKSPTTKKAAVDDVMTRRRQWPWTEFPPTNSSIPSHILQKKLWLTNHGTAPPVTKSWLPTTTRCDAPQQPQLCHVSTNRVSKNPNPHPHNHFVGDASIAETAYEMPDASHWCLLKSDMKKLKSHPPLTIPSNRLNLLGPGLQLNRVYGPSYPSSGLMVSYTLNRNISPNLYWYREFSVRHECTKPDPFDSKKKSMVFTSVVESGGKFYATSLQGAVAVMQVDGGDARLKITAVGSAIRGVPSSDSRFFKEYLSVMEGEILLVFLIHRKSLAVVDDVEVYRLDLIKLDWIRVEKLLGKTMFLNERCVWVHSEEFGCRDDRVYFTQGLDDSWRVFDMKRCCILPFLENEWVQTMIAC